MANVIKKINNNDIYQADVKLFVESIKSGKFINDQLNNAILAAEARIFLFSNSLNKIVNIL